MDKSSQFYFSALLPELSWPVLDTRKEESGNLIFKETTHLLSVPGFTPIYSLIELLVRLVYM